MKNFVRILILALICNSPIEFSLIFHNPRIKIQSFRLKNQQFDEIFQYIFHITKKGNPLHFDSFQSSIQFFELMNLTYEEVTEPPIDFGISNMDHVLIDVKVNFRFGLEISF